MDVKPEWLTRDVVEMARSALANHTMLPILGDALQDAGCDNQALLQWCYKARPVSRLPGQAEAISGFEEYLSQMVKLAGESEWYKVLKPIGNGLNPDYQGDGIVPVRMLSGCDINWLLVTKSIEPCQPPKTSK